MLLITLHKGFFGWQAKNPVIKNHCFIICFGKAGITVKELWCAFLYKQECFVFSKLVGL